MSIWNCPPSRSDIVIVGGGLMGCSIAYHLAKRGVSCCLIEAKTLASGASGRNDGQIILETADYYTRMKAVYGAAAAFRLLDFKRRGQRSMHEFLTDFPSHQSLAYHQDGSLTLAINDAEARILEEACLTMQKEGFDVTLVDREAIAEKIHTRRFSIGKWDAQDASVNPAELTRLIAAEAKAAGAFIVEGTEVIKIEEGVVYHSQGKTECEICILATNAYTSRIIPDFANLIFPIRGQILATQPTEKRLPAVGCIANFGYDYWHWTRDGRLILGGQRYTDEHGEVGFDDATINPTVSQALDQFAKETYPEVPIEIAHRWSGIMGFSKDGRPLIGPIAGNPSLWCAAGFTGYGLGMCWAVGLAIAQVLNDETSELTEILPDFTPSRFT